MPELPEVETIARNLHPRLQGRRVQDVEILWEKSVAQPAVNAFREQLRGERFREVGRRGKYLLFGLEKGVLVLHLRMSGDLAIRPLAAPAGAHDRLRFEIEGEEVLAFVDPRKFGRAWLVADPQPLLGDLGPEPFDPALDAARFHAMLRQHNRQLKPLLLDQRFLAGVGNIYSDEALFRAGLHPLRRSSTLSADEAARLLDALRQVLADGIRHNGTTIDWVYRGGNYQQYLQVYGHAGEPCPRCGAPIRKIRVGQRGTHFCPVCQKE
jgi:formamidopyrimidine-DNA glycosylase